MRPDPAAEGPTEAVERNAYVEVIAALLRGDRSGFVSSDELMAQWALWDAPSLAADTALTPAQALAIAGALTPDAHWRLDAARRELHLTPAGREALAEAEEARRRAEDLTAYYTSYVESLTEAHSTETELLRVAQGQQAQVGTTEGGADARRPSMGCAGGAAARCSALHVGS